jgi:hypothetical protein
MSTEVGSKVPVIGAQAIFDEVFEGELSPAQVYRLAEEGTWPIFRLRSKLACFPDSMRAHMRALEAQAIRGGGRAA